MKDVKIPHTDHDQHLCYLHNMGVLAEELEEYKKLVRHGKYVCGGCGRVAENEQNLCSPRDLYPED